MSRLGKGERKSPKLGVSMVFIALFALDLDLSRAGRGPPGWERRRRDRAPPGGAERGTQAAPADRGAAPPRRAGARAPDATARQWRAQSGRAAEGRPRRGAQNRAQPMSARSGAQLLCAERRRTADTSGGRRPPRANAAQCRLRHWVCPFALPT